MCIRDRGMVEGYIEPLTKASVGEIIDRGGTIQMCIRDRRRTA